MALRSAFGVKKRSCLYAMMIRLRLLSLVQVGRLEGGTPNKSKETPKFDAVSRIYSKEE